jgi:hypothetical protein
MKLATSHEDLMTYGRKYHFYYNEDNKTIVCTTLYKGQMARGIAKCDPTDNFDMETGKKLAYLRCKQKFAHKKLKRANKAYAEAITAEARAKNNLYKAADFLGDAAFQLSTAKNELVAFEQSLNI